MKWSHRPNLEPLVLRWQTKDSLSKFDRRSGPGTCHQRRLRSRHPICDFARRASRLSCRMFFPHCTAESGAVGRLPGDQLSLMDSSARSDRDAGAPLGEPCLHHDRERSRGPPAPQPPALPRARDAQPVVRPPAEPSSGLSTQQGLRVFGNPSNARARMAAA